MFRPTPQSPSAPLLDRRGSDTCRPQSFSSLPSTATTLLTRVVTLASRQPRAANEPASPTTSTFHEDKVEWETLSRRGSDPSQCGYFSFPDFDRLTSTSGSNHDEASA